MSYYLRHGNLVGSTWDRASEFLSVENQIYLPSGATYMTDYLDWTYGYKRPYFGDISAKFFPPGTAWTGLINESVDDGFVEVPFPFDFWIGGASYTSCFVSSNAYITFGEGSTINSYFSSDIPTLPKILLSSSDYSYQRVSMFTSNSDYVRIRYEGDGDPAGIDPGQSGIIFEITFFNPNLWGSGVIEILAGDFNGNYDYGSITINGDTYQMNGNEFFSNESYLFIDDGYDGTVWNMFTDAYALNTGY